MTAKSSIHLTRVRRLCLALPESEERLSHGEPTFFVRNKVFVMFADDHHGNGHLAVWLPVEPGLQEALIGKDSVTYFRPPYVGHRGWVGIELGRIGDDELGVFIEEAWERVAPKRLVGTYRASLDG